MPRARPKAPPRPYKVPRVPTTFPETAHGQEGGVRYGDYRLSFDADEGAWYVHSPEGRFGRPFPTALKAWTAMLLDADEVIP